MSETPQSDWSPTAERVGAQLSIAPARTVLQSYLYAFARNRPGSIVWIVDDDMRLDPLVIDEDGGFRRRSRRLALVLRELRRLRAAGTVDIAIGAYTGAPSLPIAATVRVQLVDLTASLRWLTALDPRITGLTETVSRSPGTGLWTSLSPEGRAGRLAAATAGPSLCIRPTRASAMSPSDSRCSTASNMA